MSDAVSGAGVVTSDEYAAWRLKRALHHDEFMATWRVGRSVPLNVYEGDRPVCQCHTAEDAARIVAAVNFARAQGK